MDDVDDVDGVDDVDSLVDCCRKRKRDSNADQAHHQNHKRINSYVKMCQQLSKSTLKYKFHIQKEMICARDEIRTHSLETVLVTNVLPMQSD